MIKNLLSERLHIKAKERLMADEIKIVIKESRKAGKNIHEDRYTQIYSFPLSSSVDFPLKCFNQ